MEKKKEMSLTESFEFMRNSAELKAISNISLERPLTDEEYNKMILLAEKLNIKSGEWTT